MQNISYFCIVKRFKHIFKATWLAFLLSLTTSGVARAQTEDISYEEIDSVRISLLTCGPGRLSYELYGHTAIRIEGYPFTFYNKKGEAFTFNDVAVNWGLFSFKQPHFILRFIFGRTDYRMGISPMEMFLEEYEEEGRWVYQQKLNLLPREKRLIIDAVKKNDLPENRFYRYDYLYDNCTTRADKMITDHLNGSRAAFDIDGFNGFALTYRDCIHYYNSEDRWARLGNDLLLGLKADRHITHEQSLFLPINLMNSYEHWGISEGDSIRMIVSEESQLLCETEETSQVSLPSPMACATFLMLFTLVITIAECIRRKIVWLFDAILLSLAGLCGIILFAMIFSEHPTVQANLQILLLNPLALLCLYHTVRHRQTGKRHWLWQAYAICILLFFLGNFLQHYAEGMNVLALCLLIRCYVNIKIWHE
ncbi:MAG: DUF4105 domain-containing protein [Prevotella sp.]|nr:DUF4105 domain-containing protein [Prevotella sp.]